MIVDEIRYVPISRTGATLFFRGNSYRMRQHADVFNTLRNNPSTTETETSP